MQNTQVQEREKKRKILKVAIMQIPLKRRISKSF